MSPCPSFLSESSPSSGVSQVQVSIDVAREEREGEGPLSHVLLRAITPEGALRTPTDICCVIDVSGSMGMEAQIKSASGQTETHGLSLLDVAKHGLKTIIQTLAADDRLSIISFNSTATTILPLTAMDEEGRKTAMSKVEDLCPGGGTDMWRGMAAGLDCLREGATAGHFAHTMVLTDGVSQNKNTIVPNLNEYRAKYERLPGTVSTFGFGYAIDSEVLVDVAKTGQGTYAFIPDAGFVGTVFVNTISNLLTTIGVDAKFVVETRGNAQALLQAARGQLVCAVAGEYVQIEVGTIQLGQSRDAVLDLDAGAAISIEGASLQYTDQTGRQVTTDFVNVPDKEEPLLVMEQVHRSELVDLIMVKLLQQPGGRNVSEESLLEMKDAVSHSAKRLGSSAAAESTSVKALLEDLGGQILEAVSENATFQKWGFHYLPSLACGHRMQQCNNFKDPGVQVYGGSVFAELQEKADDIFNELPPPKPSLRRTVSSAPPVNMASYNDRYSG